MSQLQQAQSPRKKGFTLIEMIGVLAIIAILVAAVAPRIFEAIEDSRVTTASTMVKAVQVATTKYFSDMGTLLPISLNPITGVGAPTFAASTGAVAGAGTMATSLTYTRAAAQTAGAWPHFRGPYMESFSETDAPLGTDMRIASVASIAPAAAAANVETNYDLTGDGTTDIALGSTVVSLVFNGVTQREWEKLDGIIDAAGMEGLTDLQRQQRGRVKYAVAAGIGTIRVYIAHR